MSTRMSRMAGHERWYHGKISRREAEEKLRVTQDGSFLVRESTTHPGCFALSTKHQGKVKHRLVHSTPGGSASTFELKGSGKPFNKLTDLVKYYQYNYMSTDWEILKSPCPTIPVPDAGRC